MAKITAPNKDYNGVSAGVRFVNGTAECNDEWVNKWFREHNYTVEEADKADKRSAKSSKRAKADVEISGTTNEEVVDKLDDDKSKRTDETPVDASQKENDGDAL